MGEERQAPRVGVALFDGSRLDSIVNTDSRWPTSLWLTDQLYMGTTQDTWNRSASCFRRTRYVAKRSPRNRFDQMLRRRVNTAKSVHTGVRGDDDVSHYGAKSETAIDFRRGVTYINCGLNNAGAVSDAMDTFTPDDHNDVRKTVTFDSEVDNRNKSLGERRDRGRFCSDSNDGSRVGSEVSGGVVPHIAPFLRTSEEGWPSDDGVGSQPYHIGSSCDFGAPPRPTVDPSVSNTARQLLNKQLRTQVLSFPRISVELQRKALGSAPRYENVRNAVFSARAHSRAHSHTNVGPAWETMTSERAGLPTLQTPCEDRKATTAKSNQYGPMLLSEVKPRDKYSRMTVLGLPRVNIDIDRPLSYARHRRARNHRDAADGEAMSDAASLLAAERARAAEVIRVPVEDELDEEDQEDDAWPGDVVARTNGVDLDAVTAAAATENGFDQAYRNAEKTRHPSTNTQARRRKDSSSSKVRNYNGAVGVVGVSCKMETPRKDTITLATPASNVADTSGR